MDRKEGLVLKSTRRYHTALISASRSPACGLDQGAQEVIQQFLERIQEFDAHGIIEVSFEIRPAHAKEGEGME